MKLSILMPVFNEEKTIEKILQKIIDLKLERIEKEIIVIDDGSKDKTNQEIKNFIKGKKIKFFTHRVNQGKGAAVRTGIENSTGDYIVIQDADLEYDPNFIKEMLKLINPKEKLAIYGTRLNRLPDLNGDERHPRFFLHYFGNRFLSIATSLLYGQWITDMETCYKLFPRKAMQNIRLNAKGFELEPEITAKLLKNGYKIREINITTTPRGYSEGKKLNTFRDGFKAIWTLTKYRVSD